MFLVTACPSAGSSSSTAPGDAGGAVAVGAPAPALAGPALDGASIDLSSLKGRVVVVDFWASWCEPCRRELPELEALHQKRNGEGLTLIGVNIDEQRADAEAFLRDQVKVSFPVVHDAGQSLAKLWSPPKMPTLYVIDREGKVAKIFPGELPGQMQAIEAEVTRLLGG